MDCSTPGLPVLHNLPEFAQTHVHWVSDAIQPSHPLLSPSSLALNLSQHQGLFQSVGSSHQVAKVLVLQLQYLSSQWMKSKVSVAQSCPTLCNPMDCSPPGSSIHGIFQASVLEWVAIPLNIPMNTQGWFPLGLTWSPCGPRDPQESFPEPQFKS